MNNQEKLNIKAWAHADRPREKLIAKGKRALTNSELIALLIGSGNTEDSAVELSKKILRFSKNDLNELSKLSIADLMKFKGIGFAKAIGVIAAFELGKRMKMTESPTKRTITCSRDAFEVIEDAIADLSHEEFWIILLNRSNSVLERVNISKGGVSGTIVDLKILFKLALERLSSAIILCHNHPSGNLRPSHADMLLTQKITAAGKLLDIPVLDHLIVSERGFFSFSDEGLL